MSKKKEVVNEKPIITRAPKKWEQQLRVKFTDPEINAIARKLAESNSDLIRAEEDKKAVTSQLKAKSEAIAARVGELSSKINAGFEYRNTAVETVYDCPSAGLKTTTRLDTGEIIETEPMTLSERQIDLPLTEGKSGKSDDGIRRSTSADGVVTTEEDEDAFIDDKNNL